MDDVKYFPYGEKELAYLRKKDKKLSAVIDRVGHIERAVDDDLFSAVVHHIVGQQIFTKAQATVWARVQNALGTVDAEHVLDYGEANLQSLGISFRKAEYITDFAKKVHTGEFDLISIGEKPDEEVILELSALKGSACGQRKCCFYSACSARMCSATATSPFCAACAWSTATRKSTAHGSSGTANVFRRIAASQVYISGRSPAARSPNSPTPPRRNRRNKRTFSHK